MSNRLSLRIGCVQFGFYSVALRVIPTPENSMQGGSPAGRGRLMWILGCETTFVPADRGCETTFVPADPTWWAQRRGLQPSLQSPQSRVAPRADEIQQVLSILSARDGVARRPPARRSSSHSRSRARQVQRGGLRGGGVARGGGRGGGGGRSFCGLVSEERSMAVTDGRQPGKA